PPRLSLRHLDAPRKRLRTAPRQREYPAATEHGSHRKSRLRSFFVNKLVEAAVLLRAVQKCYAALVENFEKLVPTDLLERIFRLAEINAQQTAFALAVSSFDDRGMAAARLGPFSDLL